MTYKFKRNGKNKSKLRVLGVFIEKGITPLYLSDFLSNKNINFNRRSLINVLNRLAKYNYILKTKNTPRNSIYILDQKGAEFYHKHKAELLGKGI